MANIKRKIEDLKPGKEYLLTVRAKNPDVNVTSDYAETIRFTVPQDGTIPGNITNLALYASFEKIMFVFDYSSDLDIDQYEYELYDGNDLETSNKVSFGFNPANVFTVAVENSYTVESAVPSEYDLVTKGYYGRVRGVDTTGNVGIWTDLTPANFDTPLIGEEFINSLTASKITAGTIGAHTIQLNGANSVIKSSTFNGIETSTPGYYTDFTNGWLIDGNGNSYFVNTNISGYISGGTIDIGGNDDTSFHVDSDGRMWAGSTVFDHAKFRVDNNGVVRIGDGEGATPSLWIDQTGAITIGSTPNNGDFIVSSAGQISIGGNDSTSFHIKSDGTVSAGDTIESATPPFRLNNDGSIDIGGNDASSMHILSTGNVQVGATKDSILGSSKTITGATATATEITYTCSSSHGFTVGQTVSITGINSSPGNKLNFNNRIVKSTPTLTTFTIDNPLIVTVTGVNDAFPAAGSITYTTATAHGFQVGQSIVFSGISPTSLATGGPITEVSSATTFAIADSSTGTATLTNATARGSVSYLSGGSVKTASPFNITASTGDVRTTNIDVTGIISGTGSHLDQGNALVISDTIAIGRSKIVATESYSSYQETGKLNFQLDYTGFIARLGTASAITINSAGYSSILPVTGSAIRASGNGSAAAPAYQFATATDGFYTDGTNPFWSNSGTGYKIWHAGNDGDGSGLNADTLDGLGSSSFVQISGSQTISGTKTFSSQITFNSSVIKNSNVAYSGGYVRWSGSTGGTMGYSTSSSVRYKENIEDISSPELNPTNLLNIPVKQFVYKDGYLGDGDQKIGELLPGLMAEDINQYYPSAGTLNEDNLPESWDPFFIIPPMLKLIQDLYNRIEELENRLN